MPWMQSAPHGRRPSRAKLASGAVRLLDRLKLPARTALLLWVLGWSLFSLWILSSMRSQAVETRREALADMCEERARLVEDKVKASMTHFQALAILVSTFHRSKSPSAMDQQTFARYVERTETLTSGLAYAARVMHAERELFERQQAWSIKQINTSKYSSGPASAGPAEEYAPVIFAQDAYKHVVSFDMLTGNEDRENVLRARESGKVVLTAPFKLLNDRIGVMLTYAAYKSELRPNATEQHRVQSAIGYLGGIFDIETHVDSLLHQLAGKQSIMVSLYDTTSSESPIRIYGGANETTGTTDMIHISCLDFGDPLRKHQMHCWFLQRPPLPWPAIASSVGTLVVSLLIGYSMMIHFTDSDKRTAKVIQAAHEQNCLKSQKDSYLSRPYREGAPFFQKGSPRNGDPDEELDGNVDQKEMEGLHRSVELQDKTEGNLEEPGTEVKELLTKDARIQCLSSRFGNLSIKLGSIISLLGLVLCILIIGAFHQPFNQGLGKRRGDRNITLKIFGWSRRRLLVSTLHGNTDVKARKYQEETTQIQNGTVRPHLPAHKSNITTVGPWIALVSVIMLVLGIAIWLLLRCNRRKRAQQNELDLLGGIMGPRRFQLHELVAATGNFADEKKLGRGGFGHVYKGYLRDQDLHVAIKVLCKKQSSQEQSEQGLREFKAEVKVMAQLRHRNIVKLVGWCDSKKRLLLVYELMAQGSLDKHLYDPEKILTWQQRFKIVLDLCSGLLYLHRDCEKCIVHGDIKPANVMLDASHNAKLGDFGLARLVEHGGEPQTTQVVAGTPGYIDPEFVNNRWPRTELDVYSFGVVLLEIACGKRPASRQPDGASSLLAFVHGLHDRGVALDAADRRLNGEFDRRQMERVIVTGLWCAHQDPTLRPSMAEAMDVLRSADAELPVIPAGHDARHIRSMEEQAYGDLLPVGDRSVRGATPSAYFTSKDSVYLLAEE